MPFRVQLTTVPIFQFVSSEAKQQLSRIAKVVEKEAGAAVLLAGETVPGIYFVVSGQVGVFPAGAVRPLVTLGPGDSFGEMSFLENAKASATIRAESAAKLIVLMHSEMQDMVDSDAAMGRALFRGMSLTLSKKLRKTTDKIAGELQASRALLTQLINDGEADTVADMPRRLAEQQAQIAATLEAAVITLDELIRNGGDLRGPLGELQRQLVEAQTSMKKFGPRLGQQLEAVTAFIKSIEEFILDSARD